MANQKKRYNLVLPMETFEQVRRVAKRRHSTVAHTLRQFIRLGLAVEGNPDATLIVKHDEAERELVLL